MSIKIFAGRLKGRNIKVLNTSLLRPTSAMLRRKIFDANQALNEIIFVDCFSGSGSVGIEAYSRGAKEVFLIEKNKKIFQSLKQNLHGNDKLTDQKITIVNMDFFSYFSEFTRYYLSLSQEHRKNIIINCDPPYEMHNLYFKCFECLQSIKFDGLIWIESDKFKGPNFSVLSNYNLKKIKEYKSSSQFIMICHLL